MPDILHGSMRSVTQQRKLRPLINIFYSGHDSMDQPEFIHDARGRRPLTIFAFIVSAGLCAFAAVLSPNPRLHAAARISKPACIT